MKRFRFLILLWILPLLTGCSAPAAPAAEAEPCRYELMAMDTIMTLTIYDKPAQEAQDILQQAAGQIHDLDTLLSVTDEKSEIYRVNHSDGTPVSLSEGPRQLPAEALALCESTDGALDVTIYPVVRSWGFTTGDYRVPEEAELAALLARVDYTRGALEGDQLTLPAGMELDLGAVAKGWTGDRLMEFFPVRVSPPPSWSWEATFRRWVQSRTEHPGGLPSRPRREVMPVCWKSRTRR